MPKAGDLVGPTGQPLIPERNIVVVKTPKGTNLHPQLLDAIGMATKCSVIQLPLDAEFMMGELAAKEVESIHHGIHAIFDIPDIGFLEEELAIIYAALRYLCEKTDPGDNSKEVAMLKKVQAHAK